MATAGAGAGAGIPDDWEHVDNSDNFSVISLPTSEDDLIDLGQDLPAIPELSASDALESPRSHPRQSKGLTRNEPHPHDTGTDLEERRPGDRCVTKTTGVVAKEGERVNNNGDLDAVHELTNSLAVLVSEILANGFPPGLTTHISDGIKTACATLSSHINRLQGILHGYAQHRRLGSRLAELPVGLDAWMESLKVALLRLKDTLNSPGTDNSSLASRAYRLRSYLANLKAFSIQMDGLMAVIQIDYEEFHTLHMPMLSSPSSPEDSRTSSGRRHPRSFGHTASGNRDLVRLRRELYVLKDQIVACLGEIQSCEHHGISNGSDQRKIMTTLTLSYRKTKESLELMLSNHGGDWIDHSIAGGLTYPEFCRLNPDTIRSLILQLKEVTDDMFLERSRAQTLRYKNSPKNLSRNEGLIMISPDIINTLRTLEEVIVGILQIRKSL
ncbi:hypothetical protein F5Y10DRAFT_232615 [Nemania abortiva]|nr:hypothetical protein F5Y10DRAFT_232615 [Nemania abortiva]